MTIVSPSTEVTSRSRSPRGRRGERRDRTDFDHGTSLSISRKLRASAGLPSGRAMTGALLVTVSALGVIAAYRQATAETGSEVIIVNRAIEPGAVIEGGDLAYATMDLVSMTQDRAFLDPDDVIGTKTLVALQPGDLITPSVLIEGERSAALPRRSLTLSLDVASTPGGKLHPGDRVDVISLADAKGSAEVIVRDARVADSGDVGSAAIGSSGRVEVTLDVSTEDEALAIIGAAESEGITLVRAHEAEDPA